MRTDPLGGASWVSLSSSRQKAMRLRGSESSQARMASTLSCGLLGPIISRNLLVQQPSGFVEDEVGVHEGFVADVVPADEAGAVDQERAVQRHVFKVVVGAVSTEHRSIGVRDEREVDRFIRLQRGQRMLQ